MIRTACLNTSQGIGAIRFQRPDGIWNTEDDPRLIIEEGSPIIDAGKDLSHLGFSEDSRGVKRPQGKGWDLGAVEWSRKMTDDGIMSHALCRNQVVRMSGHRG